MAKGLIDWLKRKRMLSLPKILNPSAAPLAAIHPVSMFMAQPPTGAPEREEGSPAPAGNPSCGIPANRTDKYRMPDRNETRENSNTGESEPDPEKVEQIMKLSVDLTRFLRLYAMDLLQVKSRECTLTLDGKTVPIVQSDNLFDAFVAIDERVEGDWSQIGEKTDGLWRETAVEMVLHPQPYQSLWQDIRTTVIRDASFAGRRKNADTPDVRRNYKSFTVLCLSLCDKVLETLTKE